MALFSTAHLPEGFPRVSQPQAGSRQTFSCCSLLLFPPLLPSHACLVFLLHLPLAFHILIDYSLSRCSHAVFLGEFKEKLVCAGVFAQMCNFCVHCVVSIFCMLRMTPRVQRLVTTDLGCLQSFCQACLLLRNTSPYLLSRSENARTEWDSVGFNSAFDTHSIPTLVSK